HERDISHSSVERIVIPDSCIALNYMLDLMIKLIKNLIIYPENMIKNLNLTRGLIYSQTVLLKLVDKGLSREEAYRIVQTSAMDVWANENKNLKDELLKSSEVMHYLSGNELNEIFNPDKILKNVDYIFQRSIFSEE
ncbi:MAG: adenylosuccinate lyase, partial [Ignavibacteriaceae bacterium]|nr:adenylosuccinate lyase [Ignavibacteriaceae bacterium]